MISSLAAPLAAQPTAPKFDEIYLASVYPAGGQRGTTVSVELHGADVDAKGVKLAGLKDALGVVIDGPPGITVGKVENVSDIVVRAELTIAPDAAPGRRMVRVVSAQSGLTNFNYFVVGTLPEVLEQEKNNEPRRAQEVTVPAVVNGRIAAVLDVDCFRFAAKKGQRIVASVAAHAIDSRGRKPRGFVDAALELLDAEGRVVGDAADVIGLDPLVEAVIPADGQYTARVKLVNYQGHADAVYRLTLGEAPLPVSAMPVAVRAGTTAEIALAGPNMPPGTTVPYAAPAAPATPLDYFTPSEFGTADVRLLLTDTDETIEREPNDAQAAATALPVGECGVSGRFDRPGDVDWYKLTLKKNDKLRAEIHAQRYLRSPVDTHLALFDAQGNLVTENDELVSTDIEQLHDFETFDSLLNVDAKEAGDYYLRVTEQTGASGDAAVYHLTLADRRVDVRLHAWPDGVPVWGPGSTAGFLATIDRLGASNDVELAVEGLPDGWTGSTSFALGGTAPRPRAFLTITAPADAEVGDVAEFRVVGRMKSGDTTIERTAQPLTGYLGGDRQICRVGPTMRAVVARDLGLRLATDAKELNVVQGQKREVVVKVDSATPIKELPVSVNLAGTGFRANLGVQQKLPVKDDTVRVPIASDTLPPGRYAIVVALAWDSETRKGRPGPCTQPIMLNVTAATAAK